MTRAEAEREALSAGSRVALARADSAAALARVRTARERPNPTLSASYSKSPPNQHLILDIPVELPGTRGARIDAAEAAARAARLAYASERLAVLVEVDTTYTTALAAAARFRLSRQTAADTDSLRRLTERRRDAGDASDLDVDLATVAAGQQRNTASADSLAFMSALLTVQLLMGLPADSTRIALADSLAPPSSDALGTAFADTLVGADAARAPPVLAAEASLLAAESAIALQRRSVFSVPSITAGIEFGDPETGNQPLPTIGIALPLPLFHRNGGAIAEATAERERARATLLSARLEARRRIAEGVRERDALRVQVARDGLLVRSAERLVARSLVAYREGASSLPSALEARRTAREVLGQYIDDVAALLIVDAELRALSPSAVIP